MSESELIPYRGNCHCGAVVYELKLPEIKKVNQCNCSNCLKKGYLLVYPGAEAEFKILKGEDALTGYRFHTKNVSHKVCFSAWCTFGGWLVANDSSFVRPARLRCSARYLEHLLVEIWR